MIRAYSKADFDRILPGRKVITEEDRVTVGCILAVEARSYSEIPTDKLPDLLQGVEGAIEVEGANPELVCQRQQLRAEIEYRAAVE